jgi:hypothetical protein
VEENLPACPRCKHTLAAPTPPPADPILGSWHPPTPGQVYAVAVAACAAVLSIVGGMLAGQFPPLRVLGWSTTATWPLSGLVLGAALGALIGVVCWLVGFQRTGAPAAARHTLTPAGLAAFLTRMGYEYTTLTTREGTPKYLLQLQRGGASFAVGIDLSPNQANLWFSLSLRAVPAALAGREGRLLSLLQGSWDQAPAFFSYCKATNQLCLMRMLENRDLPPAGFRAALDEFLDVACQTYYLWETDLWDSDATWKAPSLRPAGAASSVESIKSPAATEQLQAETWCGMILSASA